MGDHFRHHGTGYLIAIMVTAAAVLVRWLLNPLLDHRLPFATLYAAVAVVVWFGGWRPALIAALIGYLAALPLFIESEPHAPLSWTSRGGLAGLAAYLLSCSIIIGFAEATSTARRRLVEQKVKAQEADVGLQAAVQQLQIVTESISAPVSRCSRDLHYLWVSKPYADWIGRAPDEIIGRSILDITGQAAFDQLQPHFERVLGGETVKYEEAVEFRGLGRRWINAIYTPTFNKTGVPDGWVAVVLDITDRKRMEEALRQSEQRLAAELEAMTRLHALSTRLFSADKLSTALDDVLANAIVTSGADFGNIQLYNPEIRALEILAQRGFRPDFLDHFRTVRVDEGSACAQAMQSGKRIIIEDVELDPVYVPHRQVAAAAGYRAVQSTPLKSSRDGNILGMLSTHFRQPQQVSERNQRLLDLYARHAADLIERFRFEQALAEADRRKDEFLATLAHELRNPLAPIRNALQLLKIAGSNPEISRQAREIMERQVQQMVRLVDDLLDLSRITRSKIELRRERVGLAAVMQSAVETSRPLIEAAGHRLSLTLPATPVYVDADVIRLAQVFSNLLNNAAKFTQRGGQIWLTAEREGSDAVVTVRDNGMGIPAPMLPRIFDMFTQVERSPERSPGGLGIGLTLVKRLVELHGGSIEARSAGHGQGSEFSVRLPVVFVPATDDALAGDPEAQAIRTKHRILVVDDNKDAATSMDMVLRIMGNEVQVAHDGLEAVDRAATFKPNVVLLDIGMPKLNGYDAARRIRQLTNGKDMVLVALTGWGQDEDKRRATEAGFDHHLTKPVDPAALEQLLAGV
jgi:PAS domain S-box-containing protein